jgi:hypothetical protein
MVSVYVGLSFNDKVEGFLPEATLLRSIFNKRISGLSGLFEIASGAGLPCQPWQSTYRELKNEHGLLVIVSPIEDLSGAEVDQILTWVHDGNTLIFLDDFQHPEAQRILKKLGLHYKLGKKLLDEQFSPCPDARACAHVEHLVLSGEARVEGGRPIVTDKDGALLTEVRYGKGYVLIGTTPGLCANRELQSPSNFDNFQFIVNWLSTTDGSLFFDEKCHGFSNSSNIFTFLLGQAPGLVFIQILIILAIAVLSNTQRFGEAKRFLSAREISSLQFIDGLANAYDRAKATLAALEIIVQDFKTKLCKELGLSPHSSLEEIAVNWQNFTKADSSNLRNFLTDYERACGQKRISTADLKKYVLKCDELARELKGLSRRNRER